MTPTPRARKKTWWAAVWWTANPKGDEFQHFIYENNRVMVRSTRREVREHLKEKYGYIATRQDLRIAPHWWRMPKIVRVTETVELAK